MKKYTSIFLAALVLGISLFGYSVKAAVNTSITLKTVKNTGGSYTQITSAAPNDTVTLQIHCNNAVENVGGISITVYYDSAVLAFREQSYTSHIVDDSASFLVQPIAAGNDKGARINIVWDTSAQNTNLSGLIFSLAFDVLGSAESGNTEFTAEVKSFFLSDKNQTSVNVTAVNPASLTLGSFDLAPFKALAEGIRYDDETLANIVAAESIFNSFTGAQASAFIKAYPDLYKVFSTARTTYNRLAQSASQEAVLAEAKKFISDFSDVWALEETTENLYTYEERILLAQTTYKALSDSAKSRISKTYTDKIGKLLNAVDNYKDDIAVAEDFKNGEYSLLWRLDDETVRKTYSEIYTTVSNAKIAYNGMSDFAKTLAVNEYNRLTEIEALIADALKTDTENAAISEKTSNFMQKYSSVFTLNTANVSVEDKSAIEMVIKEYEKLDEDVKSALASRINNLKKLLTVISANDKTSDNTPIVEIQTVTETVYVDRPGETKTVIKNVAGETVTEVVSKTVKSPLNKFILYISTIILFGLVMLTVPVILLYLLNRSIKKAEDGKQ